MRAGVVAGPGGGASKTAMIGYSLPGCLRQRSFAAVFGLMLAGAAFGQSNVPPAVPPVIDAGIYQRVVDENVDLRREQARLTRDANDLRRRNASLLLQVQELERKQDALATALAGMQSPAELRAELEKTRKDRDALSREFERLRAEPRGPDQPHPSSVPAALAPSSDSDLYRRIEHENSDLRAQLAKANDSSQSEAKALDAAGQREAQLTAQVEGLTAQLGSLKRDADQQTARERVYKAAIAKVARKAIAYEAALREANAKTVVVSAPPPTNTASAARQRQRSPEVSVLAAVRNAMTAGRYRDAERLCRDGLDHDPKNALLHYNLGVLYDDYLGDPRAAAVHYRKYLDLSPDAPDASIVRSWLVELDMKAR